jgi:hypothetical protein
MTTTLLREIAKHRIRRSKKRGMQIGEERGEKRGEKRGIQIGEERGMQIGEERGMQIGEERGAIRGKREAVIRCLSIRFQNPIPHDINEKLESYSDLGVFDFLFQFAMTCESLDDFRKRLI